jgi:hypothetical protein
VHRFAQQDPDRERSRPSASVKRWPIRFEHLH